MEMNSPDSTKNGNSAGTTDCAQSASPSRTACAVSSERASTTAITASSAAAGAYRHLIRITSLHSMSAVPGLSPGQASFPAARHRLLRMGGDAVEKKKLTQVGLAAMERLDLPGQLAADVPQMQLTGKNDFYMLGHKGVLSYSTELIEISGGSILVRVVGSRLQLLAMTEEELRIGGAVDRVELVG